MNLFDENTGKGLGINGYNQALMSGVIESEMSFISRKSKDAYTIYGRRNFLAALTDENVFYLKYTGSRKLKIKSVTVSSDSLLGKAEIFYSPIYTSGGTLLAIDAGILNQDRSSGNSLDCVAYHGGADLVMTTDSNLEVADIRLNGSTFEKQFDGVTLPKNSTFGVKGSVGVIGEKIRVMIECYEVDE